MSNFGWSRWVFVVVPAKLARPTDAEIRHNAFVFGRQTFGPTVEIRISIYLDGSMAFDIKAAGHPVLDVRYVDQMKERWRLWAALGFGEGTTVECRIATPTEAPPGAVRRPA